MKFRIIRENSDVDPIACLDFQGLKHLPASKAFIPQAGLTEKMLAIEINELLKTNRNLSYD